MVSQVKVQVTIGNVYAEQVFTVVNTLTVDCLLGSDFLIAQEVMLSLTYKRDTVLVKGNEVPFTMNQGIVTTSHAGCR